MKTQKYIVTSKNGMTPFATESTLAAAIASSVQARRLGLDGNIVAADMARGEKNRKTKMTYHTIPATEARDYMPTAHSYALEGGEKVMGVLQQLTEEIDTDAAEAQARKHFGPKAVLRGEGEDIEGGVQWMVIEA